MKIMSINAGSSSLKFSLFDMTSDDVLIQGVFERIGLEGAFYTLKYNGEKIKVETDLMDCSVAVKILLEKLIELGVISNLEEIEGVGHRIVHGGDKYAESVMVTDEVVNDIIRFSEYNNGNIIDNEEFFNKCESRRMCVKS